MSTKEFFDILMVVPLEEELQEVIRIFPGVTNRSTDTIFRYIVDAGVEGVRILLVQQEDMGRKAASRAIEDAFAEFQFGLVVCLGIAGSLTDDLRLCDVCYSGSIMDVYDNAKAADIEGGIELSLSPSYYSTPPEITAALNFLRTFPELHDLNEAWAAECEAYAAKLLPEPVLERDGKQRQLGKPKSKNGILACGVVTKSAKYNATILAADRRVLAIETESGGIFEEAGRRNTPCLTIRGISDHADKNKGRLEAETGAKVRRIAASNAARFLRTQLQNKQFRRALQKSKENGQLALSLQANANVQVDIATLISSISRFIDERLRELSPEFRLQSKGYRLPVPRMREVQYAASLRPGFNRDPVEIRDALAAENCVLLSIERRYPDYSLPWVIASDLLTAEIGGKQVLPVVVAGERIRPPQQGITAAVEYPFSVNENIEGTQLVYIFDELPLSSNTRIRFLEEQIKSKPNAKFVIVTRNDIHLVTESEFAGAVGASFWQLASVSFLEIAHFVQKNFEITASEAEVIALRLRNTFQHFDLSAHPTYFAGISKEVLTALLQANRRAELIQLAVDGFLTFVVAADKSGVVLSRTTRARFLRSIAREIRIERRAMNEQDVVAHAKSFFDRHAFENDPIRFVASFVDSGILHFQEGTVRFSLPFVESYLLALELLDDTDAALSYFSLENDDVDIGTFDLYAELGASDGVVKHVLSALDRSIERFSLAAGQQHVLLTSKVRPQSIKNLDRFEALQKSLRKTTEDVISGRGDVKKKQRLLDVADKVREVAVYQSGFGRPDHEEISEEESAIRYAIKSWAVATTLVGAGAEDLNADIKSQLISKIISLASIIIHCWTNSNSSVSFDEIKEELTTDEALQDFLPDGGEKQDIREARRKIEGLIEVLEFAFMAEPFVRVVGHICEGARQKVLATSVESAAIDGLFEKLLRAIWLLDIDEERGRRNLLDTIRELPPAPFLRIVLATHFLIRVYWNHWKKEHRLILLDAADEIIKPISRLNKGELIRLIEHGSSESS